MNKSSYIKSSIINQSNSIEEFNIINSISNLNIQQLEYSFNLYNKVNQSNKHKDSFIKFRQNLINSIVSFNKQIDNMDKSEMRTIYENVFC